MYIILMNCILKNGYDGKFYAMSILPQQEKIKIKIRELISPEGLVVLQLGTDRQSTQWLSARGLSLTMRPCLLILYPGQGHTNCLFQPQNEPTLLLLHQFCVKAARNLISLTCLLFKASIIPTYVLHKVVMRVKVRSCT